MKIATWNINGTRARIETALAYLNEAKPDVLCLQEIKSVDEAFPREAFSDAGYNVETHGQKGFNGVAILSKRPLEDVKRGLPGDDNDQQARWIEATVTSDSGPVKVISLYLPNGNPIGTEKFTYKLAWMARLKSYVTQLLEEEMPLVISGDYNVIPEPEDAKRPDAWRGDALFQPESRGLFRELQYLGLTDALRACEPAPGLYTFWDYQAGAFQKNDGIRIDHFLLSPEAANHLTAAGADRHVRGWEKPSDHIPVWIEYA